MAGFGLIFLLIFPPALIVNDSWLNLMAGREVVENGLPSRDEITVYGLGATWTDQQWLAQVFMYGDVQPRRLRAPVGRDVSLRRERILHRRCRVAPARRRPACDLAPLPSRPHLSGDRMDDPRADARAPPLHRPSLAPRDRGAVADETGLARAPTARDLGERARKRRAGSAARDAPRRVRAHSESRKNVGCAASLSSSSRRSQSWPRPTGPSRPCATTTCSSSTPRLPDA